MSKPTLLICDEHSGALRSATPEEILEAARATLARKLNRGARLESPRAVRDYLALSLSERPHEIFGVIYLDNRHRVIEWQELFRGTIDGASVHPREVVKEALARNAAAVILVHNHPSGVAEPSQADELVTRRVRDALLLVEIRVLDHLIVAGGSITSLAEQGCI